jgi:hypothetical protein
MSKRTLIAVLSASLLAFACGGEEEVPEESAEPIMGLMEFPISHRLAPSAPANAIGIELSPTLLRLDGRTLIELEGGRIPDEARAGNIITALRTGIESGPARRAAELSLHANTPYITTALLVATLKAANVAQLAFAVRTVGEPNAGFLTIDDYETREEAVDLYEFPAAQMPAWGNVATHWEAMYTSCRENHYVDCAFKPSSIAEGGQTHITLFARGNAVKIELHRVGEPVVVAPTAGPEMIEGIGSAADQAIAEAPPAEMAAFTWRYNATTDAESPVSGTMRPLCGAANCGVLLTAEALTPTMRILSFIGAAFPTGTDAPNVVFQIPAR